MKEIDKAREGKDIFIYGIVNPRKGVECHKGEADCAFVKNERDQATDVIINYEKAIIKLQAQRAKDKQAVMSLFAKYGKGLFLSKQLQSAIKISEGLAKIYKEVE